MTEKRVIIVDSMNFFIRHYQANPTMSSQGHQVGGIVGFIRGLKNLINEYRPDKVIVVWESGGSARRRSIFSEYKMNRKPEKLNRFYEDDIPDTDENRIHQTKTLIKLLSCLPVCQVYVQDCEADDVIAYLCRNTFAGVDKIVVSTDRDFYQLLDVKETTIYNAARKNFVNGSNVKEEFHVHAKNFALAKAICGDAGDNIDGVPGVGFKTLVKRIPLFGLDVETNITDVISYCQSRKSESKKAEVKFYEKIVDHETLIRRNWKLVFLDSSIFAGNQIAKIEYIVDNFKPKSEKMKFLQAVVDDGIKDFYIDDVFTTMMYLESCWETAEVKETEDDKND